MAMPAELQKVSQDSGTQTGNYGRVAMSLLEEYGIEPSPNNYAVWFAYASGANKELVKELNAIIKQKLKFSREVCDYFFHKYVEQSEQKKILEDTTLTANNLLAEILGVIKDFSGETDNYHHEVDEHVQRLTAQVQNTSMQDVVKQIIASAASLKKSGQSLNQKLNESTKEIEQLKTNLNQIASESQKDFLTGIANRKALERALDEQVGFAKQTNAPLCLLMIDIDHFKQYNDKYGHLIGDEVLKIVAKKLVESVKGKDIVARYGGEEFAVVLPSTPIEGGLIVGEALRKAIAASELRRRDTGEKLGDITISIGVSLYRFDSDTIPKLIQRADTALYASKKNGRNRVTKEE